MRNPFLCSAAAILFSVSPMMAAADSSTYDIGEGRKLLKERCGSCHGTVHGELSRHADAPTFPEVVKRYPPETLEEALAEGIVVGHPDMPIFHFSPTQVGQIVAFLKSLE